MRALRASLQFFAHRATALKRTRWNLYRYWEVGR